MSPDPGLPGQHEPLAPPHVDAVHRLAALSQRRFSRAGEDHGVFGGVMLEVDGQLHGEGCFAHPLREIRHSWPELHVHFADGTGSSRRAWRVMTVFDLRCDRCDTELIGPGDDEQPDGRYGIRFLYHPGDFLMKDDSGLLCQTCWTAARRWLGADRPESHCARCAVPVEHSRSVHIHRSGDPLGWQLCPEHAVAFLNQLRTVDPKLSVETLTLAGDW